MTDNKRRLSPEQQRQRRSEEGREQNRKKRAKKARNGKILTYVLLILIFITLAVCLCYTVLFKVQKIETAGESNYSSEQIIDAAGVYTGQSMLSLSPDEISSKICKKLPFVKSAEVKRILPSSVKITVESETPALCVKYGESFLSLSEGLKVLEQTDEKSSPTVVGLEITSAEAGDELGISDEAKQSLEKLKSAAESSGITDISVIDMTDLSDIRLLYKENFVLSLGSADLLEYKLKFCMKVADSEQGQGVIDVKYVSETNKKGFFNAKTIKDEINLP